MKKILIVLIAILFASCNDGFSPNGDYTPKLIVYSVLDAATDTQYVRVYSSFSPEQYVPDTQSPNTEIVNAVVRIADDSTEVLFRDTVITIQSGGSAKTVRVYMAPNFRPKEKKQYQLTVQSGSYPVATSSATGLDPAQIIMTDTKPLFEPLPEKDIIFDVYLGKNSSAYLGTLFMEYEVLINGAWKLFSKEMPIDIVYDAAGKIAKRFYPIPVLYRSSATVYRNIQISYQTEIYSAIISEIKEEHQASYDAKELRFKDVRFTIVQFDNEVFTYYSVANNFPGATTIRLDEPDYSNMKNGYGIFGTIATQVKVYGIPGDFP